jgi:16S rRNA (cytosine967-C5)-methyltransferase
LLSGQKPREIAGQILQRRSTGNDFIESLLDKTLSQTRLSGVDRGLCQELVYGVVRWQSALDWLIARKTPGRSQKLVLQNLLRLGLYQIFWLDRIPNHAAVNETVEQAKQAGFGPQAGFVNAVLRGYLREFDATKQALMDLKITEPHVGYSHPDWLVKRWRQRLGPEQTGHLLDWNNLPARTYARINTIKADPGKLLEQWREENVDYDFVRRDWFEENLVFELKSHPPLAGLPSFQKGLFYIQDPSTLLAVHELNAKAGEAILDLCAAPGGKTTYIAQRMRNEGQVVAHDTSSDRIKLVEENCARLGVTCVRPVASPNPSSFSLPASHFDKVLVDAPCSNTGVMRRRVDLRWRIRSEEIERLRVIQLDLLRRVAPLMKPNGTLVYSTCSLESEENSELIAQFLSEQKQFKLENQRELLPFKDGVDGAFVARFTLAN